MISGIYVKGLLLILFLYVILVKEMLRTSHQITWSGFREIGQQKLWDEEFCHYDLIIA